MEPPQVGEPYSPRYRDNVISVLRLLASREEQLSYQSRVPIAHVSAELFCQWADDSFSPDDPRLQSLFSPLEWQTLLLFNSRFESISARVPEPLPPIGEFVHHSLWDELTQAAQEALRTFLGERDVS